MKTLTARKVALATKIVCASIGVLPASVLMLAQIDISTLYASAALNHTRFYRDILEENPDFGNIPLSNIGMLASHDALSNGIGMFTGNNTHQTEDQTLYKWGNFLGRGTMVRLSRAQDVDVYQQLNAGVRYIDARICRINGVYYNSHTLLSDKLETNLKLILKWLCENPGEFIVFHIYDFFWDDNEQSQWYETEDEAWAHLREFIESVTYEGKNLFDYDTTIDKSDSNKIDELTYNTITNYGANAGAVIFYCSESWPTYKPTEYKPDAWYCKHLHINESHSLPLKVNGCAGRMKSELLIDHVNNVVGESKEILDSERPKYLRYLQIQTTPNDNDIFEAVTAWSLVEKARQHNNYILHAFSHEWWKEEILPYIPIFMCDNSTCNDNGFNSEVIQLLTEFDKTLK